MPDNGNPKVYWKTNEVAQQFGYHSSWVIRQIQHGTQLKDGSRLRLHAVRGSGQWLIKPEWLEEYLEAVAADYRKTTKT